MRQIHTKLKDGTPVVGDYFDDSDYDKLASIFQKWIEINEALKDLGGRSLNVPDVLSEALYCYYFQAIRTNGTAYSYDAVDLEDYSGVQIKSTSIKSDLTSFGPRSTWDKLFFLDFAPDGKVTGQIDFYYIDYDIRGLVLNSKGETFLDQQRQGRRPRFSIKKDIIQQYNLRPIKTVHIG